MGCTDGVPPLFKRPDGGTEDVLARLLRYRQERDAARRDLAAARNALSMSHTAEAQLTLELRETRACIAELEGELAEARRRETQARAHGMDAVGELFPAMTTGGAPIHVIGLLADEVRQLRANLADADNVNGRLGLALVHASQPDNQDSREFGLSAGRAPDVTESETTRPNAGEMMSDRQNPVCGLCGHEMALRRCGLAGSWENGKQVPLCHADDHDCYHRWTVYKERPNAG